MKYLSEVNSQTVGSHLQPLVKREHLNKTWIGIGTALEWIALRGQAIFLELYYARENEADEALVSTLTDLPLEIAESIVRVEPENNSKACRIYCVS